MLHTRADNRWHRRLPQGRIGVEAEDLDGEDEEAEDGEQSMLLHLPHWLSQAELGPLQTTLRLGVPLIGEWVDAVTVVELTYAVFVAAADIWRCFVNRSKVSLSACVY